MTFSTTASIDLPAWRSRALDRSLEEPRAPSVARMESLVTAARELANESGNAAFTVAQVAERAGCSLKGFYGCFGSKDELLLALLEDDSRLGAGILLDEIAAAATTEARLHAYVTGIFRMLTHPGALGYAGVLVREHRRLSEEHPDELDVALESLVGVLVDEIRSADAAGAIRPTDPARDAHATFALVLAGVHDVTLGRAEPLEVAEVVWRFVWRALGGTEVAR
jgi:AcrR family transcriptional regulator